MIDLGEPVTQLQMVNQYCTAYPDINFGRDIVAFYKSDMRCRVYCYQAREVVTNGIRWTT